MRALTNEDLAYMRGVQQEFRQVQAVLYGATATPDGLGGTYDEVDDGMPVTVRLDSPDAQVPADLATRYGLTNLVKVTMDLVPCDAGDVLEVGADERYVIRTSGTPDRWVTAVVVYATRDAVVPPPPVPAPLGL